VLVVSDDEEEIVPERRGSYGLVDVGKEVFSISHVVWRMLVCGLHSQ
jgi:hypothetical protein